MFFNFFEMFHCFFEVSMTGAGPLKPGNNKYINFDKVRVKKVNKTGHYLIGELKTFIELDDDYQV